MSQTPETNKKIWELRSRFTGDRTLVVALDQTEALLQVKGDLDRYAVHEVKQYWKMQKGAGWDYRVAIPTETCPYQYGSCNRPEGTTCGFVGDCPDLQEWLKRAHQAHLCPHVGQQLTKKDHMLKQKWVTMADAVKELSAKLQGTPANASS